MWFVRRAAALSMLLAPALAFAREPPKATLDYVRQGRAAEECPDEGTFRALVAAKLGYDPFGSGAPSSLRVVFRRAGADLSGNLTLSSGATPRGERTLHAAPGECDELAASLALAAAVAVDPDAVAHRESAGSTEPKAEAPAASSEPPPPPVVAPAPPPAAKHEAERPVPEPSRSTLGPRVIGGAFIPWGLTPGLTAGVRLGAGLDGDAWLLGLEGSLAFGSSQSSDVGTVTARYFDAALVPCFRPTLANGVALALCGVGRVGALRSDAEGVTRATPETDLVLSIGPRAGVELFPWRSFGFGAELEMPISLTRVHLLIEDEGELHEAWASSRVGMIAAITLIFRPR